MSGSIGQSIAREEDAAIHYNLANSGRLGFKIILFKTYRGYRNEVIGINLYHTVDLHEENMERQSIKLTR